MIKIDGTAYIMFDVSGSVDSLDVDTYKEIYDKYNNIYKEVEVVGYSTKATWCKFKDIINNKPSGGTFTSSGLKLILPELILSENPSDAVIIVGDGDVWNDDIEDTLKMIKVISRIHRVNIHEIRDKKRSGSLGSIVEKKKDIGWLDDNIEVFIVGNDTDIFGKKIKKEYMLVEVEHKFKGKKYEFTIQSNMMVGDMVICHTKYGCTYGKVTGFTKKELTKKELKEYKGCWFVARP